MDAAHVYVLNLRHRTDRKEQFTAAWTAAGLPTRHLHWFPAIWGADLPAKTLADFRTVARTRKARAGRVGCYCSHVAAIEAAVAANHFPLLVLEDDAVPTESATAMARALSTAPQAATLQYWGALPVRNRRRVTNYCARKRRGWRSPTAGVQLYGGHAYGIPTAAAATELLTFLRSNKMTFDSALIRYTKAHPSQVAIHCPFMFVQAEGYSDIEGVDRPVRGQ